MQNIKKYRIYCNTDSKWEYVWEPYSPTVCPTNAGHTVNDDSISDMEKTKLKTIDDSDSPYVTKKGFLKCDTSSGAITVHLPPANKRKNKTLYIQNISGTNTVTVTPDGSDLWDASNTSQTLTADKEMKTIRSDGTSWASENISIILAAKQENEIEDEFIGEKGSLIVDTANGSELFQLGSNGQILCVDNTTASGLKWGNVNGLSFSISGKNAAYFTTDNESWTSVTTFLFRGTSVLGTLSEIKFVAATNDNSKTAGLRVYDITNSQTIGTVTYTAGTTQTIVNLGTLSNVPAGESIFELQTRSTGGDPGDPRVYHMLLTF